MLVPVTDVKNSDMPEDKRRACSDLLRNAETGMMSWAEKNFRHKLIDKLYELDYYRYNKTVYVTKSKGEDSK